MAEDDHADVRRARWRRRSAYAAGALFLLAVIVVGAPRLVRPWLGQLVLRRLGARLGREVTASKVAFGPFSGFHAHRLRIGRRAGFGGDELFSARRVDVETDGWALLAGRPHVTFAHVHGPTLVVVRGKSGALNVQDLLDRWDWGQVGCDRLLAGGGRVFVTDQRRDVDTMVGVPHVEVRRLGDGSYRLEATVNDVRGDEIVATLAPEAPRTSGRLPELPADLRASFEVGTSKVIYGRQSFDSVRVVGTVARGVVEISELSARTGTGSLAAEARVALGGDGGHSLSLRTDRLLLDQDFFETTRRVPHLELLNAALPFNDMLNALMGGMPDELRFLTTMKGDFEAEGDDLDRILTTLKGRGDATLTDVRFLGSPLFRQIATLLLRPELAQATHLERVDAPFTIGGGRLRLTSTATYQRGALFLEGSTALKAPVRYDYKLSVRNPRGIQGMPSLVADYLDEGHPIALIGGTRRAPIISVPTKALLEYMLRHKRPGPQDGAKGQPDRPPAKSVP